MTGYDLMHDTDTLEAAELRHRADRVVFLHEFAVAYEEPIDADPGRGYLTAWVRGVGRDADYERKQGFSGDDGMIRDRFAELATGDTEDIERFIEGR